MASCTALPTYSVHTVKVEKGLLNALGTAFKSAFGSILGQPIVSVDISGELAAAQKMVAANANRSEIFGCGKNEIEQQLQGIFRTIPQYHGYVLVVEFPGMQTVPASRCQALQKRLVTASLRKRWVLVGLI